MQVRDRDAYLGLDTSVKNFITCVPLVADLRSPSMRDRHWKQLMDATKVSIVIDSAFKLDDLLKLELHKYEEEVGEIVDRAQKEEKMEMSLKKLDEVWSKLEFDFHQHKDTDVFTAKLAEENFEARAPAVSLRCRWPDAPPLHLDVTADPPASLASSFSALLLPLPGPDLFLHSSAAPSFSYRFLRTTRWLSRA